jgi:hypothetical protein
MFKVILNAVGELLFTIVMVFAVPIIAPLAFRQGSITHEEVIDDTRKHPGQFLLEVILSLSFALGLGIYWHPVASILPLCTFGWLLHLGKESFWGKK